MLVWWSSWISAHCIDLKIFFEFLTPEHLGVDAKLFFFFEK